MAGTLPVSLVSSVGISKMNLLTKTASPDGDSRYISTPQRWRPPPYRVVNSERKLIRRMEYSRMQRMFRSNTSRCVKSIPDNDDGDDEGVPDVETMSGHRGFCVAFVASRPGIVIVRTRCCNTCGIPSRSRWHASSCHSALRLALTILQYGNGGRYQLPSKLSSSTWSWL